MCISRLEYSTLHYIRLELKKRKLEEKKEKVISLKDTYIHNHIGHR